MVPLRNKSLTFEQDSNSTASNSVVALICPSIHSEDDSFIGDNVPETGAISHSTTALLYKWREAVDSGADLSMSDVLPTSSDITTTSTATTVSCKGLDTGISTDHEEDGATGLTVSSGLSIKGDLFDICVVEQGECTLSPVNGLSSQSQDVKTSTDGELTDCNVGSLDTKTNYFEYPQLMVAIGKKNGSLVHESAVKMNLTEFLAIDLSSSMERLQKSDSDDGMFTHCSDIESVDSRSETGLLGNCSCVESSSYSCEYCQSGCDCSCSEWSCSCSCEDCKSDYTWSDYNTAITGSDIDADDNSSSTSSCTCENCTTCSCEDSSTCCPSGRNKTPSNVCSFPIEPGFQSMSYACSDGDSVVSMDSKADDSENENDMSSFDCNEVASYSHSNDVSNSGTSSNMDESTDSECSCDYCVHEYQVRDIISVCTLGGGRGDSNFDYDGCDEL